MAAMLKREAMAYAQFLAGMAFTTLPLGVRDGAPAGRFQPAGVCNARCHIVQVFTAAAAARLRIVLPLRRT